MSQLSQAKTNTTTGQACPSGASSISSSSPRRIQAAGGDHNQTDLRAGVVKEMVPEILECPIDDFLNHYAPFVPSQESVTNALQRYKADDLEPTKLERTTYAESNWLKDVPVGGQTGGQTVLTWAAYDCPPSQISATEMEVFEPLQGIVDFLKNVGCREKADGNNPHPPPTERTRNYSYRDCPAATMKSEIPGTNFKIDACITSNPGSKEVILSETAVLAEFKKGETLEEVADNREKLLSAANQVLNDDPLRTWVYGITIENTEMSLWYFCRSHSVKSTSFNFTNNVEKFIQVFLSFLYATPEEIGYDPTVHRVSFRNEICYVYEMGTPGAPRYFRTKALLFTARVLCITGRKTRVWKAVEVEGYREDLLGNEIGKEVALKDGWLDEGSRMEREIQDEFFKSLEGVKEADYNWAPNTLRNHLNTIFQQRTYKDYFMLVAESRKLMKTKVRSSTAQPKPSILSSILPNPADPSGVLRGSTQGRDRSGLPSSLHSARSEETKNADLPREYRTKEQHRLIYPDVGCALHHAKDLDATFNAIRDTCIALILLYLARWTHRDVSMGNIIVLGEGASARGKLSDLEYAKAFGDSTCSADPKTGTPYFMPLEIHESSRLYTQPRRIQPTLGDFDLFSNRSPPQGVNTSKPTLLHEPLSPPKFRFQHDLESLWWIILWILLYRVKHPASRVLSGQVFTHHTTPSGERKRLFHNPAFASRVWTVIHDQLQPTVQYLDNIRETLRNSYLEEKYSGDNAMFEPATYSTIYVEVWNNLTYMIPHAWHVSDLVPLDNNDGDGEKQEQEELRPHQELKPKDNDEYVPNADEDEESSDGDDEPGACVKHRLDQGEEGRPQAKKQRLELRRIRMRS